VTGEVAEESDANTALIEHCVELAVAEYGDAAGGSDGISGGHVRTESEVPMAAGLKSSSAAANATVLAALDALGVADEVSREEACRLGVRAAREAGVTVTGAFDDASASMLGGVTVTDNGFAFCAALDFPADPMLDALPDARGVSLSGTGPSFVAVGGRDALERIHDRWNEREGTTWLTRTRNDGARTR
jgi:shikimate kinase